MSTIDYVIKRKYLVSLKKAYKELEIFGIPNNYQLLVRNLIFNETFRNKIFDLEFENIIENIKWLEIQSRKENPRISLALTLVELNIKKKKLVFNKEYTERLYLDYIFNI